MIKRAAGDVPLRAGHIHGIGAGGERAAAHNKSADIKVNPIRSAKVHTAGTRKIGVAGRGVHHPAAARSKGAAAHGKIFIKIFRAAAAGVGAAGLRITSRVARVTVYIHGRVIGGDGSRCKCKLAVKSGGGRAGERQSATGGVESQSRQECPFTGCNRARTAGDAHERTIISAIKIGMWSNTARIIGNGAAAASKIAIGKVQSAGDGHRVVGSHVHVGSVSPLVYHQIGNSQTGGHVYFGAVAGIKFQRPIVVVERAAAYGKINADGGGGRTGAKGAARQTETPVNINHAAAADKCAVGLRVTAGAGAGENQRAAGSDGAGIAEVDG